MKIKEFVIGLLILASINWRPIECPAASAHPIESQVTAFVNVNVIPMDEERILYHQTVIIRNGRISEIGPAATTKTSKGAKLIDGRGKYLMPGLVDMHAHVTSPDEMLLWLLNGVTTVRNMEGRPTHVMWRNKIARGEMLGPTLYTSGPFTNEPQVKTPAEAERAVIEQKRAGYDFIKVHGDLSQETYARLCAVAQSEGIPVIGHVPRSVPFEYVLAHQASIDHAEEYLYTYFNSSVDDVRRIPAVAAATHDAGIYVTATLVAYDDIVQNLERLPELLNRPGIRYVAPWLRQQWAPGFTPYRVDNGYDLALFKKRLAFLKKLMKGLRDAHAHILMGTDAGNFPGMVPGESAHEELRHYVDVGFTTFEALKAGTYNAAEFLHALNEFGVVAVGRRADLILLNANPLENIAQTARRAGIMVRGRWLPETEIRKMLEKLPASYSKEEQFMKASLEQDIKQALDYTEANDPFGYLSKKVLTDMLLGGNVGKVKSIYQEVRARNPKSALIQERALNSFGYELRLLWKRPQEAIEIFKLNVELYPKSANVYYSLGRAYMVNGDKELAARNFRKSLELNPQNTNAAEMLKQITQQ